MLWNIYITLFVLLPACQKVADFENNLCGNGIIDSEEVCDGTNINITCSGLGYSYGTVKCSSTCEYDTSQCTCETCGTNECINLESDPNNCGRCRKRCESGQTCHEGICGQWKPCGDTFYLESRSSFDYITTDIDEPYNIDCEGNYRTDIQEDVFFFCNYECCNKKPTKILEDIEYHTFDNTYEILTGNNDHCGRCGIKCPISQQCFCDVNTQRCECR